VPEGKCSGTALSGAPLSGEAARETKSRRALFRPAAA
jgi:hypothetical protein